MVALGELMKEAPGEKTITQIAQEEVAQLTDPQSILKLIEQELLPVSGLNREFNEEIETTARDLGPDFFRAYSKVTDPELGALALRWIQGGMLSNSERLDLGLDSAGITKASDAKQALRFLLGAFKRADFAVMFCLDEFERFSSRGTLDDQKASAGLLKDLAETFKGTGHLLVVSGANDAWNLMKKDVFDRIKQADIVEMRLSETEAKGLLDAYCQVSYGSADSVFEPDAIHLLYDAGNQNTRRILNLAHHAYEIATSENRNETDPSRLLPIKVQHLEKAANELLSDSKRQDAVEQSIQGIALDMRLPFQKDFQQDSFLCDYILGDPQRPQVAIEVTKSIFKLGEVSAAREIATLSQAIRSNFPQTRFCVVIVGYSTLEVRNELAKVVDRVFSFDEDSFAAEFREFLKSTSFQPADVEQRLKSQESAYQELQKKFDQLEGSRRDEIEQLKRALDVLQSGSLSLRETAREKRVTDKMGETLAELTSLTEEEESLAFRVLSTEEKNKSFIEPRAKLERVLRLIDDQRTHLRRADVLNEKLPQAEEFQAILRKLAALIQSAEELWDQSFAAVAKPSFAAAYPGQGLFLDDTFNRLEIRKMYRERRDLLSELENLHPHRAANQVRAYLNKVRETVRRINLLMVLLWLLALVGVAANLYLFGAAWVREGSVASSYSSTISYVQQQMAYLKKNPSSPFENNSVEDLIAELTRSSAQLNSGPSGTTYTLGYLSPRADDVRSKLDQLTKDLRSAQFQPSPFIQSTPSAQPVPSAQASLSVQAGPSIQPSPSIQPTPAAQASPGVRRGPSLTASSGATIAEDATEVDESCRRARDLIPTSIDFSGFAGAYWGANRFPIVVGLLPLLLAVLVVSFRRYTRRVQ